MEQGWNFVSGLGLTLKKENIKTMDHILLALIFKIPECYRVRINALQFANRDAYLKKYDISFYMANQSC